MLLGTVAGLAALMPITPFYTATFLAQTEEATPASSCPAAEFKITTRKQEDTIEVSTEGGRAVFSVSSPSGISSATVERLDEQWPDRIVVRMFLRGLESFAASTGKTRLSALVLSHSGHKRLLRLREEGKEERVEQGNRYWMDIKALDAKGRPIKQLPEQGGYFEMILPKALFKGNPKSLTLGWIDFYRS